MLIVFISYPVIGLLADTKLTRYQMICLSCWILFVFNAAIVSILSILLAGILVYDGKYILLAIVGKGMFVDSDTIWY